MSGIIKNKEHETYEEDCKTCYFDGVEDPRIIETNDGTYHHDLYFV